ncbi:metal-dependent hydrolase [Mycobacterium sp. CBMA271]|uniref:metal-dependent hydrolase n=1 Tax=unclassified Mycobacteroides TaxID=2618759 RepID=UPI0012DCBB91|nr:MULTISPECIES: metal-dependent hydrolase [unclassified Mycobacteroides]MUM19772.1 metal-dependent hydrolase [Mycobacteroides sp. CBMA 326]MUM21071.1 metal-dependent hydrolase [Mycobacteroides sp. CBMA 271]
MKNQIQVRRISFQYPVGSLNRHYVQGDLILSHMLAVLSAVFPEGEEFFVQSVRHFSDRVTDPELQAEVRGFTGQEVTHGREHRILNDRLHEMGYPTHGIEWLVQRYLGRVFRHGPKLYSLALTAALEHFTATVAETLLDDPKVQELLGDTEVRSILLWHALEESEHKAVAFDVYRTAGGTERMRIWTMRSLIVGGLVALLGATAVSMLRDRATYNPIRVVRSINTVRRSPFFTRQFLQRIREYNRIGFHPSDIDHAELIQTWQEKLFGEEGALVDHLKRSS